MKIWTEEDVITNYYIWIGKEGSEQLKKCMVKSINASEIDNVDYFAEKCNEWLRSIDLDIEQYSFYIICNELVKDPKSRVERYKKIWMKLSEIVDTEFLEKGYEFEKKYGEQLYYSGIARFAFADLGKILNILNLRQRQYLIFLAKEKLLTNLENQKALIDGLVSFDKDQYIDFEFFFEGCLENELLGLRYGNIGGEAELAAVVKQ